MMGEERVKEEEEQEREEGLRRAERKEGGLEGEMKRVR